MPTGLQHALRCFLAFLFASLYSVYLYGAAPGISIESTPLGDTCPDLENYVLAPGSSKEQWLEVEQSLSALMSQCLLSSDYFALLGASQLNSGFVADAIEALERALLLNPQNGGAQIDYAQALYLQGQLFPALELNRAILARSDIPTDIAEMLDERQQLWRQGTRKKGVQADLMVGHSSNLNSAPNLDDITLTLSGEPVTFALGDKNRPQSKPYLNFRIAGLYQQNGPENSHNWLAATRGRFSTDEASNLLQFDGRYTYIAQKQNFNWQINAGLSNLFYGGSPLYTATESSLSYIAKGGACLPQYSLALQHQHYHNQVFLNALESKLTTGIRCPIAAGSQQLGLEISWINNEALKKSRPGGSRDGWQMRADWQRPLFAGLLVSQLSHTRLVDNNGYSDLLSNGAKRTINRTFIGIQYRQALKVNTNVLLNFYHQRQSSNLELFKNNDTTIEVGVSGRF